jgi:hypothetical protein
LKEKKGIMPLQRKRDFMGENERRFWFKSLNWLDLCTIISKD